MKCKKYFEEYEVDSKTDAAKIAELQQIYQEAEKEYFKNFKKMKAIGQSLHD